MKRASRPHDAFAGASANCVRPGRKPLSRTGAATVLALIFLAVFFSLALAFASTATTSVHSVADKRATAHAQSSVESGIEFFKSVISACPLDGKPADDLILAELGTKISEAMPAIAPVPTIIDGEVTRLSFAEIQPLGSNIHFGATVDRVPVIVDGKTVSHLLLTVTGRDANQPILRRATIRLAPEELGGPGSLPFLDYGVFAGGRITMSGGGKIQVTSGTDRKYGSVFSAKASGNSISMSGSFEVAGKVHVAGSVNSQVTYGDNTVNGVKRPYWPQEALDDWLQTNFSVVDPPEVPEFDPSMFKSLATNVWVRPANNGTGLNDVQANVRIPRNSGTPSSPLYINGNGNMELQGIVYIESPNNVVITGGPNKLNCIFVFEKSGSTTDFLKLQGNTQLGPIPDGSQFDAVRNALAGYSFLAPAASVELNAYTTTGEFLGSLICSKVRISGGSSYRVKNGSIIALSNADDAIRLEGSGSIFFDRDEDFTAPTTGYTGGGSTAVATRYIVMPGTYLEAD